MLQHPFLHHGVFNAGFDESEVGAWNSIRVQPGDEVERGQYIADSGNTGFSSGPHLHFAVLKNVGMRIESVAVMFAGPNWSEVQPKAGNTLTAY